jgi:Ala-tRNA(Pro) deacylase
MPPAPCTPDQLFARLDALGIAHRTYSHPPVFTVAEAVTLRGTLPGGHCKSLFLKDKKAGLWLVVALEERQIDLKRLAQVLGAPRFSFGNADLLYEVLGVRPGSVTPFALVNDTTRLVAVVLDRAMLGTTAQLPSARQRPHPAVAPADLLRFIAACGHRPRIVDLDALATPL